MLAYIAFGSLLEFVIIIAVFWGGAGLKYF